MEVAATICNEYLRLFQVWNDAVSAQVKAMNRLDEVTGTGNHAEYNRLFEELLICVDMALGARIELDRHRRMHGCGAARRNSLTSMPHSAAAQAKARP